MKTSFTIITSGPAPSGAGESLERLPAGARRRIAGVDAQGEERTRLEAMGLCGGRMVEVVKPGEPMIVRVLDTRIGLAGSLARSVRVEGDEQERPAKGKD